MQKKQEEYWDRVAKHKQFNSTFPLEIFRRLVDRDARILDYGCGYGRILAQLHDNQYWDLHGVDASMCMIERAEKQYPQFNFIHNDGENIPFANETFDAVLLCAVIGCVIDEAEQQAIFTEVARVIKPKGIVCFCDFLINEDDYADRYQQYFPKHHPNYGIFSLPNGGVVQHLLPKQVVQLTHQFNKREQGLTSSITMNNNKTKGFFFFGEKP